MKEVYEKGDWIAFRNPQSGDITIHKYHSMSNDDRVVYVYLTSDMKTEHHHCKPVRNIVPMQELKELLFS